MLESRTSFFEDGNERPEGAYSSGFFAFLWGALLIGVVLGTVSFCRSGGGPQFITAAPDPGGDRGQILLRSMAGTTVLLTGIMLLGMCPVGLPFQAAVLTFRGMGIGLSLSGIYSAGGRELLPYAAGLTVPGCMISSAALCLGAREAAALSGAYLRMTLADGDCRGLRENMKLYLAKFLVLEAVLAVAAGADVLCGELFADRFF
ncbi:MAG: hypothetical protein IJ806_00990 [Ruminococcus sp.]|nr:hypothetical protein [Ruminococcus sp.]